MLLRETTAEIRLMVGQDIHREPPCCGNDRVTAVRPVDRNQYLRGVALTLQIAVAVMP